jgi:hypothetical protein
MGTIHKHKSNLHDDADGNKQDDALLNALPASAMVASALASHSQQIWTHGNDVPRIQD